MKKLYSTLSILAFITLLLSSCSKQSINDNVAPPSANIVNATIAPNQSYQFTITDAGDLSIAKQAIHFKISETTLDPKSGQMIYQYTPALNYTGAEEVILANRKTVGTITGSGCSNSSNHNNNNTGDISYNTTYTTIKLNISN